MSEKSFRFRFFVYNKFKLVYFLPYHVNVYWRKSKKITITKNCVIHISLVFDGLVLGNYILNNSAKSLIETLKRGLKFDVIVVLVSTHDSSVSLF